MSGGAACTYLPQVRPRDPREMGWTSRHRVAARTTLAERGDEVIRLLAYRAADGAAGARPICRYPAPTPRCWT